MGIATEPKRRPTTTRLGYLLVAVTHLIFGVICFQLGLTLGVSTCSKSSTVTEIADFFKDSPSERLFPLTMKSLFTGAATVNRTDFAAVVDIGVPLKASGRGNEEVLILYNNEASFPQKDSLAASRVAHYDSAQEAIRNCKALRLVQMEPRPRSDCLAIMGHEQSYHVNLFRRIPKEESNAIDMTPKKTLPLRHVHRSVNDKGKDAVGITIPRGKLTNLYWEYLMEFLSKKDATLQRLKPVAQAAAGKGNVVVVMLVNWGQAGVFFNFVCSARSRGLDLSSILMFALDQASVELAISLGINVFDVKDSFGKMPTFAAKRYGDARFNRIMLAKVYCVQLLVELGYDVLYQDVDVVWKRNPLEFFSSSKVGDYDMLFQDDGSRGERFSPYFANSGFYFVKNNARTLYFFNVFIRMGDLILSYKSHQAAMIAIMNEHVSGRGLRVKVFGIDSSDGELFPCGYHFHVSKNYMKQFVNGSVQPYLFHMSWTLGHDVKRLFFQQLGEWYVKPECEDKKVGEMKSGTVDGDIATMCCFAEPLVRCHYRDKPSKINCSDSEPMDKGKPSFW